MGDLCLIRCGKLFDGVDGFLKDDYQILIEDDRIREVGKNIPVPEYADIIDLQDYIVTPGLIDAHVHPEFFDWQTLYRDYHTYSDEWFALATIHTARRTLEGGFTTIRAMGSLARGYGLVDAKMAIDAGYFEGSRLVVAPHSMSAIGGHGDLSQLLYRHSKISDMVKSISVGSGADFFREQVRRDIKHGADFIKIIVSGGFSTINDLPDEQQLTDDELQAIFEIANIKGIPITAHAYTHDIIEKLIGFGIKCIEHGALMTRDTAKLMEEKGVYLVPTFSAYDQIIYQDEHMLNRKPREFREKLKDYARELKAGREVIMESDIKLGYGTDHVSAYQNYESWREYSSYLKSGMDSFRALKAATSVNAEILGIDDIGIIAKGKKADIVAWGLDLLTNPEALSRCYFVMKDGKVVLI